MAEGSKGISFSDFQLDDPETLAAPLDEINRHEHRERRPLLSAVVTHKDGDRLSGNGFFRIAWKLGRYKEGGRGWTMEAGT